MSSKYRGMRQSRYRRRNKRRMRKTRRRQKGGSVELSYACPSAKITVFTSADRMEPTLNYLLKSLKKHNYGYEVLGMGKKWEGFKTKMENYLAGIEKYIGEKGNDAMAIFVDAFDVLCIKDSDKLLESYMARPRKMPIVVGTEVYCFYKDNCRMEALEWYDKYSLEGGSEAIKKTLTEPDKGLAYYEAPKSVFVNSGFIMGPAKDLQEMFTFMSQSGDKDDQVAVINYMMNHMDKIDLDIEEKLIRNKPKNKDKLPDEDGVQGPGFLHFPGTREPDRQQRNVSEIYPNYEKN